MSWKIKAWSRGSETGWQPSGGPGLDLLLPGLARYRAGAGMDVTIVILVTSSHSSPVLMTPAAGQGLPAHTPDTIQI